MFQRKHFDVFVTVANSDLYTSVSFNKNYTGVLSTSFFFLKKSCFKNILTQTFFSYETVFNNPTARFLEKVNSSILKTYSFQTNRRQYNFKYLRLQFMNKPLKMLMIML